MRIKLKNSLTIFPYPSLSLFPVLLLASLLLASGCREKPISKVNFEEVKFAPFVEPDFPFVTTSMDARKLGTGFPQDNISARCLALQLGNEAYACFDTDMLRWSVAWTGAFLPMVTMAQISYNDFFNKNNKIPRIGGDPKIATGQYPGWGGGRSPSLPTQDRRRPIWEISRGALFPPRKAAGTAPIWWGRRW